MGGGDNARYARANKGEKVINEKGGEERTRELKKDTGKSKSDLYWNPKTGDVYSVPKHGGGDPELAGNVN